MNVAYEPSDDGTHDHEEWRDPDCHRCHLEQDPDEDCAECREDADLRWEEVMVAR